MIIAIIDPKTGEQGLKVHQVHYREQMYAPLVLGEKRFPCTDVTVEFIYVGY